jgi:hypothetical protein
VPAIARESLDREGDDQPANRQHGQGPPERRTVREADSVGQVDEHLLLDLMDQLQEAPGGQRHGHADHRD